ncbi:hypothetical protein SBC1_58280 (plasmid) [Caballeronia sp. SBC1]|nr:hypothetical protein SBC2_57920 [Caballeronia sp. SBC2]QIN65782.1 hypothetical protein SBC1_58280 [Caballeronia sp. SBC1]
MKVGDLTLNLKNSGEGRWGRVRALCDVTSPRDSFDSASVRQGFPTKSRSPRLARFRFQLCCMATAANVVFQLVDRELLLDDQVPDEIAD